MYGFDTIPTSLRICHQYLSSIFESEGNYNKSIMLDSALMVSKCQDCGQEFLSSSEYKRHQQTHLQTHLDKWSNKEEPKSYPPPQGLNPAQVFEKYKMGKKAMLCLWYDGQLNTAVLEPSRILELQDRLNEWLSETRAFSPG